MVRIFRVALPVLVVGVLMCLFSASIYAKKEASAYLSGYSVSGDGALGLCAAGYHFASVWELQALSPFVYNTTLGRNAYADQGEGPPAQYDGWVRSGFIALIDWNCMNWTSSDANHTGLTASFDLDQVINGGPALKIQNMACGPSGVGMHDVWCISDADY